MLKPETKEPTPFVDLLEARLREVTAKLRDSSVDELSAEFSELLELFNRQFLVVATIDWRRTTPLIESTSI